MLIHHSNYDGTHKKQDELRIEELRRELKRLNLESTGLKEELTTRLRDRVGQSIELELIFIEIDGELKRLTPGLQYELLRSAKYREYTLLFPDGTKMNVAPCKRACVCACACAGVHERLRLRVHECVCVVSV